METGWKSTQLIKFYCRQELPCFVPRFWP